ncbi:hypothetical protein [Nocardia sp. NPDC051832]
MNIQPETACGTDIDEPENGARASRGELIFLGIVFTILTFTTFLDARPG